MFVDPFYCNTIPFSVSGRGEAGGVGLRIPRRVGSKASLAVGCSSRRSKGVVLCTISRKVLRITGCGLPGPLTRFFGGHTLRINASRVLSLILPRCGVLRALKTANNNTKVSVLSGGLGPFGQGRGTPIIC